MHAAMQAGTDAAGLEDRKRACVMTTSALRRGAAWPPMLPTSNLGDASCRSLADLRGCRPGWWLRAVIGTALAERLPLAGLWPLAEAAALCSPGSGVLGGSESATCIRHLSPLGHIAYHKRNHSTSLLTPGLLDKTARLAAFQLLSLA